MGYSIELISFNISSVGKSIIDSLEHYTIQDIPSVLIVIQIENRNRSIQGIDNHNHNSNNNS